MKMEFNDNNFFSNMSIQEDEETKDVNDNVEKIKLFLKNNLAFIFGSIAVIIALCNLPFGLFMNFSTKILSEYLGNSLPHWVFVLSLVTLIISIICGVSSIVCYPKSEKKITDSIGIALGILSFIIVCCCLLLNIFGICLW